MKKFIRINCKSNNIKKSSEWNKGVAIAKDMYTRHRPLMEALKNK